MCDIHQSARYLRDELERLGVCIISVRSEAKLYEHGDWKNVVAMHIEAEYFDGADEIAEIIRASPYEVVAVIPGAESGVKLADELAGCLQMKNKNDLKLVRARKDKFEMHEQLRRCGLAAARQMKSDNIETIFAWIQKNLVYPVVAKPLEGCGGAKVHVCEKEEDVIKAFEEIVVQPGSEMVVQEHLKGDEYIVDSVSFEGKHLIIGIWKYSKIQVPWKPTAIMPEYSFFMPSTGEEQDALASYACQVLDAVGVRNGPCHSEIMMECLDPKLVEVNARMHGMQGPMMTEHATGRSIATYVADVMVGNGVLFNKLYYDRSPCTGRWMYPFINHAYMVDLMSPVTGKLKKNLKEEIRKLKLTSLFDFEPEVKPGEELQQTINLFTEPGCALLVHASKNRIEKDIKVLRAAEHNGFYEVE